MLKMGGVGSHRKDRGLLTGSSPRDAVETRVPYVPDEVLEAWHETRGTLHAELVDLSGDSDLRRDGADGLATGGPSPRTDRPSEEGSE